MKYSKEQRKLILQEVKETGNRSSVARKYDIHESTIRGWKRSANNTKSKLTKDLEKENKLLKKIIADKELELAILKDILKKK